MIQTVMKVCLFIGLLLIVVGVGLASFTEITDSMGAEGIIIISLIIGLGLLLVIPSKIYLMLLFFQKEEQIKEPSKDKD